MNALFDAHHDDPQFGHRFLADQAADAARPMSERTAWALCSQMGWWSSFAKTRRGKGRPGLPVHDDRVQRQFRADGLDRVWLTDITEHPTSEGKLYLCAVKDVCPNRIVGSSIDEQMTSNLAATAISNAVARRLAAGHDPAGCIVHSDRGSQFRSRAFVTNLARHGLLGSIGRVGAAGGNAAMESFFALLQKNVLNTRRWSSRDEFRLRIITWIEQTYHRRRRQCARGGLTPIEVETIMRTTAPLAA